jgi:hypothetical protein
MFCDNVVIVTFTCIVHFFGNKLLLSTLCYTRFSFSSVFCTVVTLAFSNSTVKAETKFQKCRCVLTQCYFTALKVHEIVGSCEHDYNFLIL